MKIVFLLAAFIVYANCTLGLLKLLAFGGLGGGQAPAPQNGPIIITSNNYEEDDSGPVYIPIPYGGFGGYGYGGHYGGGYGSGKCSSCWKKVSNEW